MLLTPSLISIKPFTPSDAKSFEFYYQGNTQVIKNQLIIQRVSDNYEVYNNTINTLQFKHPTPPSTLSFGNYKAKIRVGDMENNWSDYSGWMFFWVLENPSINIDTIVDGRVFNQTILFQTSYSHPNGEPLESYRYLLFDSQQNLTNSFPERFADGSVSLNEEITGLQNDVLYYLEVSTISIHGQESTTGLIPFKPKYISPRLSATLTTENLPSQGAIKLSANILQLIGVGSGDFSYIDNEWIDLTDGFVTFDKGFNITKSDFVLKIWCKNIMENNLFLTLHSLNGKIKLYRKNNCVYVFNYQNGVRYPSIFVSNELYVSSTDEYMIYLKSSRFGIDIIQTKINEVII